MRNFMTAKQYLPVVVALVAFATAGAAAEVAQSGTWSSGISSRNIRPFVHAQSINASGYSAYAMVTDYSATVPSSHGPADRFGAASQS